MLLLWNWIDFFAFLWYNSIINKNKKDWNERHGKRFVFGKNWFFKER